MTTLTHTHTPNKGAISEYNETKFTFCTDCEQNIESFYIESDGDRLGMWSDWRLSNICW